MIYIAVIAVLIIYLIYEAVTAPEGWEDEEGFHYGKK